MRDNFLVYSDDILINLVDIDGWLEHVINIEICVDGDKKWPMSDVMVCHRSEPNPQTTHTFQQKNKQTNQQPLQITLSLSAACAVTVIERDAQCRQAFMTTPIGVTCPRRPHLFPPAIST